MAWELLEGGGLGLARLCVPLGAKSREGAPERCLESQVRDGRLTQMTPLLSDCSPAPALGSGRLDARPLLCCRD